MKKVLIVIAAAAALIAAGAAVFILTFNINSYKGAIVSQLESLTGNTVQIGRLSLQWQGRIVMGVEKLVILVEEPGGAKVPALSFESSSADVDLIPLLARQLSISSISVDKLQIAVIRTQDGRLTVRGYEPGKAKSTAAGGPAPVAGGKARKAAARAGGAGAAMLGFRINSIAINDGAIRFIDLSAEPATDILIRKLDARVRNVSPTTPVTFSVKMAVAGERQNVEASGTAGGFLTGDIYLKGFSFETDFSAYGHSEILRALPALGRMGLRPGLAGVLTVKLRGLRTAGKKVTSLTGDVRFNGGRIALARSRAPIERIELDLSAEDTTVVIRSFSAHMANGSLKGSARIDDAFSPRPRTELELVSQTDSLHRFLTSAFAFGMNLDGSAKISFKGAMTGAAWPEISRTLNGSGTLSLQNGVIANANMISDTLGALTLFPELLTSVRGSVPEPVRQVMAEKYTFLQPFNQNFRIEGSYIILPDLVFASTDMAMRGEGKVSLTGDLSGSGMISFSPAISNAIVSAVPQMRAITDGSGLITFPLAFKGGGGAFKVIPDLRYIGQRVAIQTAGDAVSGYLQKALGEGKKGPAAQPAGGEAPASSKPPKLKDILKALAEGRQ